MDGVSDEIYKHLFLNHPVPIIVLDSNVYDILEVNTAAEELYQYKKTEFVGLSFANLFNEGDFKKFRQLISIQQKQKQVHKSIWPNVKKDREKFFAEVYLSEVNLNERKVKTATIVDVTKHATTEQKSKDNKDQYFFLTEESFDAIWDWNLVSGEVTWNDSAKKMFELSEDTEIEKSGWWTKNLHPEDVDRVEEKLNRHLEQGITNWNDEYRFKTDNGSYKYIADRGYMMFDKKKKAIRMIGAMQDISRNKQQETVMQALNESLEKRAKELAESNEELERFAYVASHDLQEPLRMVTSFLQLLEKKYHDKLDKKAQEYIAYAVDGAERMKKLILDLLEYSKVNTASLQKEKVNLNEILSDILFTYNNLIVQTHGSISSKLLPVVMGNKTQLLQLFQNLIGNAFKYRSSAPPVVNISCEEEATEFKFSISDNGIGIDPKFFNKIFIIFQRLHTRENYSGTGIGLSICKKIIDKHGGKLWVASALEQGSTFYFTIPKF